MEFNRQQHRFNEQGLIKDWLAKRVIRNWLTVGNLWGKASYEPKLVLVPARLILKPPRTE